jgi:hypothetical protein
MVDTRPKAVPPAGAVDYLKTGWISHLSKWNNYVKAGNMFASTPVDIAKYFSRDEIAWLSKAGKITQVVGGATTLVDGGLMLNAMANDEPWGWHAYELGMGAASMASLPVAAGAMTLDMYVVGGTKFLLRLENAFNIHTKEIIKQNFPALPISR